jgi:hypothetical protein
MLEDRASHREVSEGVRVRDARDVRELSEVFARLGRRPGAPAGAPSPRPEGRPEADEGADDTESPRGSGKSGKRGKRGKSSVPRTALE